MPISKELLAEQSRDIRLEMHKLMEGGLSEREALKRALPDDSNRSRRLKTWKNKGLFPVPADELADFGGSTSTTVLEPPQEEPLPEPPKSALPETTVFGELPVESEDTEVEAEPETPEPGQTEEPSVKTVVPEPTVLEKGTTISEQQDLFELIDQRVEKAVQSRLEAIAGDVTVSTRHPGGAGRGNKGSRVKKFNVSVPTELYERLDALGGVKSQHVSHAIRLYLDFLNK